MPSDGAKESCNQNAGTSQAEDRGKEVDVNGILVFVESAKEEWPGSAPLVATSQRDSVCIVGDRRFVDVKAREGYSVRRRSREELRE